MEGIDFGKVVREKRIAKGMTLEELSKAVRRTKGYMSRIENGSSNVNLELAAKLKGILEIDDKYFLEMSLEDIKTLEDNIIVRQTTDLTFLAGVQRSRFIFEGKKVTKKQLDAIVEILRGG